MDDIAAATRRLEASAYVAAQAGLSDDEILQIVRTGVDEARAHAALRVPADDWIDYGEQLGNAA